MSRSLKKGPYIAPKLLKKIEVMNDKGEKKVIHLEQGEHDLPPDGWTYHCRS
jgi:ribosomal protein S19